MALQRIFQLVMLLVLASSLNEAFERHHINEELVQRFVSRLDVVSFAWNDCGTETTFLKVNNFSLTPDPIKAPGQAEVSFHAELKKQVAAPLKVEVHLEKKMFITWVKIPCEKGFGSCTYEDICPLLEKVVCDEEDNSDITCHCPFKKGKYDLKPTPIEIDSQLIPFPWVLVHGEYKADIVASDSAGQVACLHFQFALV